MKRRLLTQPNAADAGFTLLEILVVLIIVGILAAIAAPNWVRYRANRQVQAVQGELRQVLEQAQTDARVKRETQTITIDVEADIPTVTVESVSEGLREITLVEDDLRPGLITLETTAVDENFAFGHQGVVDETFIINVVSENTNRPHCVAALSLIGGVVSGSDDDCAEIEAALLENNDD
ncbi:MAG: prepilin-type N-terminal cleavage/methylation domain-containing protein [Leptolyngbya sp. SIO1E4]|nr:prepilin-type N-terminal cleavage/methylation domain-containing protein [Leptolyngbya sp. SIO1E4]